MLTRLRVANFKCLREVELSLAPLTVLIGPNDGGKSSLLDALLALGRSVHLPLVAPGADDEWPRVFDAGALRTLPWRCETERTMAIEVAGEAGTVPFTYRLEIAVDQGRGREVLKAREYDWDGPVDWRTLGSPGWRSRLSAESNSGDRRDWLGGLARGLSVRGRYRLEPTHLRRSAALWNHDGLSPTGDNLAAVLDGLATGPDRSLIVKIEEQLAREIPSLAGVSLRTVEGPRAGGGGVEPHKALELVLAGGGRPPITIPAAQASDGALLLLAYLAIAFSDSDEILLVEEPENGLHPSRLKTVIDLLRRISRGQIGGHPRQVILTTHSPLLLNHAEVAEVRIVQRDGEGATAVTALQEAPQIDRLLHEFGVGELWYLLGEEGLLRGTAA